MNYPLIKAYVAEGATSQFLIAKQGTGDNQILRADAAAAKTLGVVCQPGDVSAGETTDVVILGEAEVMLGGSVGAGVSIASDANGKAVASTAGDRAVGIALESGVSGDVVRCLVSPHIYYAS